MRVAYGAKERGRSSKATANKAVGFIMLKNSLASILAFRWEDFEPTA